MNKKYSVLHVPVLSFFSKRLYRDVGRNWKGANMSYLFLLIAICTIPPTLSLREDIIRSLNNNQVQLINQLPDIRITDGRVQIDQEEPYLFEKNGQTVAIIDTTGSMNYIDDANIMALLTESKLIVRRGSNQFNTIDLSQVADFHINREIANRWIQVTKSSLAPLSYGVFLLLSYIATVLFLLLAAIIGMILSSIIGCSLKFSGVMRIAAAAATPSIIMITASIALGQAIPTLAFVAVTSVYLLAGIISCTKPSDDEMAPRLILSDVLDEKHAAERRQSHAA